MHDTREVRDRTPKTKPKVLVLFGTRPEAIKLAPVIGELERRDIKSVVVSSSQHKELLAPFVISFNIRVDHDLGVMKSDQGPNEVCSAVMAKLEPILVAEQPELLLVQGDTTTALAGALSGFNRKVPVGHVEAGLRSGDMLSPFPEEMNRRLISRLATLHFAATEYNRRTLLSEKVPNNRIFVTGNPITDCLAELLKKLEPSGAVRQLMDSTEGKKRLLLTTHRRESFGRVLLENLKVVRDFVSRHDDVCLLFPVHPNPNVREAAKEIFGDCERIHLLNPLDHSDFIALQKASWLIVSDSGGVQEEAPSLGKALLVIRENTERPESITAGVAKLVGGSSIRLRSLLEESYSNETWVRSLKDVPNPFGDGHAAERIVNVIEEKLGTSVATSIGRMAA